MSNAVYLVCSKCDIIIGDDEGGKCPNCKFEVYLYDGSDHADCGNARSSKKHDNGKTCSCEPMCEKHAIDLDENDKCELCEKDNED